MSYSILIVDDDNILCKELAEILSEDYEVTYVLSPSQALSLLDSPNSIDIIIMDVRLPEMNGISLLKTVKSRHSSIPVIMMTAYGSKETIVNSLRSCADDFVEKPLNIEELNNRIDVLLGEKRESGEFIDDMDYIKYYIAKNIDKKVELKDIARIMGYSTKYMSRLFKEETGRTFNRFRMGIKMEKAKELLSHSENQIKSIAYEIGYENAESFVRVFKKHTGLTPSEYREQITPSPHSIQSSGSSTPLSVSGEK